MATIDYLAIPAAAKFKKDSSVTFGKRADDALLARVDLLLEEIDRSPESPRRADQFNTTILYGQLYHAVDGWLKERGRGVGKEGREAAVKALYLIVCTTLASRVGVGINALPNWLTAAFGRDMSMHGVKRDHEELLARYLSSAEREQYRIRFNGGVAQQMQWWLSRTSWQNVESERGYAANLDWRVGHAGYALSLGGDFYSGLHKAAGGNAKGQSFFHSSYMAGDAVRCAGTWKIVNGKLLEITDASGHYAPTALHMLGAIETLKGYGVDLSGVKIFLSSQGNPAPELTLTQFLAAAQRQSLDAMATEFVTLRKAQQLRIATLVAQQGKADVARREKEIRELQIVVEHLRSKQHFKGKKAVKSAGDCETCDNYRTHWPRILEEIAKDA